MQLHCIIDHNGRTWTSQELAASFRIYQRYVKIDRLTLTPIMQWANHLLSARHGQQCLKKPRPSRAEVEREQGL